MDLTVEINRLKEEKYQLVKLINHDIRAPFNRVYALMQLFELEFPEKSQSQKDYINAIYLTVLSGLEAIQNLKDMRELESGQIVVDNHEFEVEQLLDGAFRTFSKQVELKELTINIEQQPDPVKIRSDLYYAQRAIENVISNAVKFSPSGKEINLTTSISEGMIWIGVRDAGPGIKESEEEFLYTKFKKLSSVATGGETSLGLGLYIAKNILVHLGGEIILDRGNQVGTLFKIGFPKA